MDNDAFHMDSEKRQSLLEWLQTFTVDEPVGTGSPSTITWQAIADGVFLARVLHHIEPEYLNLSGIKDEASNWILKLANLNAIARSIENFYHDEIAVRCEVSTHVDLNRIARAEVVDTNVEVELGKLAALILYCAVNCAERQTFVVRIMALEQHVQQSVMAMLEQLTTMFPPVSPLHGHSSPTFRRSSIGTLETPIRGFSGEETSDVKDLKERLSAMEKKWQDAEQDKRLITEEFDKISIEVRNARRRVAELEEDNNRLNGERQQAVARDNKKLEELVNAEKHVLTLELQAKTDELLQVKKESGERLMVLEHEVRRQADELDISRSKLVALAKLESTVTKYKQKLDEMNTVKEHVKEVEAQNASYLEKMLDLESTVKTMASLKASIEKYKNQVVELETTNVEVTSTLQVKEQKCRQLQDELESAQHAMAFLEQQLEELRTHVPTDGRATEEDQYTSAADLLGGGVNMREQVARLQHENRQLQQLVDNLSAAGTSHAAVATPSTVGSGDILTLQNERDDALRMKQVWQDKALETKRQYDALVDATKGMQAAVAAGSGVSSAQLAQLEATNTRLATQLQAHEEQARKMASNIEESDSLRATIAELTNRLKDKESVINNLSQDKEKLETYTKKTLHAVQSKYMLAVSVHRNQISERQAKVEMLENKLKELKAGQKREQALLMSSFYEIGGEMQRRTMMPQTPAGAAGVPPMTAWLPSKRMDRGTKR
ncbi:hypothetical protein H310_00265 [Aphanomyces invadans]|uniref:Calponin-homology (CH) domain-containing protein n=1 Tax=Aphanomyces invadans TaxID=157072 RepID=A0A024UTV2_9STRA|nr:hypothetical protein H310_00265 [Aphanomyces invadans]ETW09784.1 hypothetical protein H310_00265 [Aphanomyces invadans]|eukprot:XP_008861195.1 hypothetical protein H310_00265 [Aphanomyces invadans]